LSAKPLTAEGVILRELAREDLPRIRAWRASRELYQWLAGDYRPSSAADEEAWFARYQANRGSERRYAICMASSGEHIGNLYLLGIDPSARSAEFHIFIAEPAYRDMGYGGAALHEALQIAFRELGLDRVRLQVLADNARAIALYEKTGFKRTRVVPHYKDGSERSLVEMEIARADYRPR
jgi:RimJ/RimL family protein N-acetyltransferase